MTGDQTTAGVVVAPRPSGYGVGDLAGGIAAAMVVLPQAMAYGVALFSLMGMSAANGVLAGLLGAACLSLASGAFGGTIGLVSSPTGPALALLSGVLLTLAGAGLAGANLFTALVAVTALAGVIQIVIAVSGGGRLIRFIPYPVVVGFMTGAALLMIQSQFKPVFSSLSADEWSLPNWIPFAVAIVTFALMVAFAKWLPKIPPSITGLVAGTLVFHALVAIALRAIPDAWVVGALPAPTAASRASRSRC